MSTTTKYTIRPPQSHAEWDTVKKLLHDYRNEFEDQTCFTSFEEELQNIEGLYADPRKHKLIAVAQPGNQIVGCVGMRTLSPGVAEMKRLYIVPSHRGEKLGELLAQEIISIAVKMKFKFMLLDTMHEMQAAQKLYQKLGFEKTEPYDHQDPAKVVCYKKNLESP